MNISSTSNVKIVRPVHAWVGMICLIVPWLIGCVMESVFGQQYTVMRSSIFVVLLSIALPLSWRIYKEYATYPNGVLKQFGSANGIQEDRADFDLVFACLIALMMNGLTLPFALIQLCIDIAG